MKALAKIQHPGRPGISVVYTNKRGIRREVSPTQFARRFVGDREWAILILLDYVLYLKKRMKAQETVGAPVLRLV